MGSIAVTGANGFIGKNLTTRLSELALDVVLVPHDVDVATLVNLLSEVEVVVHLAGVNRPSTDGEYAAGNVEMTERLADALSQLGKKTPVVFASSIQAEVDNPYGRSKLAAEDVLKSYGHKTGAVVVIFRLPNVFGKWCKPNYNSVVATFCYNTSRGLPISINAQSTVLRLVYIDDVVEKFIEIVRDPLGRNHPVKVEPIYEVTLGELAAQIERFRDSRINLTTGHVGGGFLRALHATYISYLDPSNFSYPLTPHTDPRGTFVEMLRTPDSGQFSFFTANPGFTRGGHYHHSKTEKFLVLQGTARFGFRHILTNETFEIVTSGEEPRIVETVPGWAHDVSNIGCDMMIVMLWANEVFDREKPDTVAAKVL